MSSEEVVTVSGGDSFTHPEYGEVEIVNMMEQLTEVSLLQQENSDEFEVDWASVAGTEVVMERVEDGEVITQEASEFAAAVSES